MIVAIDGPSGSGKSSVAREIARRCGLTYLDTGAMYRSVALACLRRGVDPEDAETVAETARTVRIEFLPDGDGQRVLVDGDIGTVVFPGADVKVFLSASPEARARRRAVQRQGGNLATGDDMAVDADAERAILADLVRRDDYDSSREASPLRPADDAHRIDSSELSFEQVVDAIIGLSPELAERAEGRRP